MKTNQLLRFLELDSNNRYVFMGNNGNVYRIESKDAFNNLLWGYKQLVNGTGAIPINNFCRWLSTEVLDLQPEDVRLILFSDDSPPFRTNEFEDPSFFEKNQSQFSGFFIFPTYSCNLNCAYCTYSGIYPKERTHLPVNMNSSLTAESIRYIQQTTANSKNVNFVFYGDEPLVNFSSIRSMIETLSNPNHYKKEKEVSFQIVTNGLLLTEGVVNFCIRHDVKLQLSVDGPPEVHDFYRRTKNNEPTHKSVIEKLKLLRHINETYYFTKVGICCTLAPPFNLDAVDDYFNKYELFAPFSGHKGNFSVSVMNLKETPYCTEENLENFRNQVQPLKNVFVDYLITGNGKRVRFLPSALFEAQLYQFALKCLEDKSDNKWQHCGECLPGIDGVAIGADGNLFVCNSFNRLPIGTVYSGVNLEKVYAMRQKYLDLRNSECQKCWLYRFCPVCLAAFKYVEGDDEFKRELDCSAVKNKADDLLKMYIMATEKAPDRLKNFLDRSPLSSHNMY